MGRSSEDEIILSYNDSVLRRSDLGILNGPYFLNDRLIEFYLTYLSSTYPSEETLLVPPAISFWLQNCSDEETLKSFIQPLNLPSKKLIIFPVNDNADVTLAEGGSHWSVLVFHREGGVFVHHDSLGGLKMNSSSAKRLYNSVHSFVGCETRYLEYESSPQQKNGHDCGLFVVAIARVICHWYINGGISERNDDDLWFCVVKEQVTPSSVSKMRGEILSLIEELTAEKLCIAKKP